MTVRKPATKPRDAVRLKIPANHGAMINRSPAMSRLFVRYGPSGAQNKRYAAAVIARTVARNQVTDPPVRLKKIHSGMFVGGRTKRWSTLRCISAGRREGPRSAR